MTSILSNILSSLVDWEVELKEAPTPRELQPPKLPGRNSQQGKSEASSNTISTDLQDLNTLARHRCWAAIEECAAQVDSIHHTTLTQAGNAPLHSAICNGAPLSTIQALIVANPPSVAFPNHFGNLPLHFVAWKNKSSEAFAICEFLLTYYPQAAKHANRHGNLPLHHATNYKAYPNLVQLLWRAYPKAVECKNDKGQTPLDHAIHRLGDRHPIVEMLQGSTARNYVYDHHHEVSSPTLYLDIVASKTAAVKHPEDARRQQQQQQQQQQQFHHDLNYSTRKEALPEIKTDTWHEVDLS